MSTPAPIVNPKIQYTKVGGKCKELGYCVVYIIFLGVI